MTTKKFLAGLLRSERRAQSPPPPAPPAPSRGSRRDDEADRRAVAAALRAAGVPLSVAELASATGLGKGVLRQLLEAHGGPFVREGVGWRGRPYRYQMREGGGP